MFNSLEFKKLIQSVNEWYRCGYRDIGATTVTRLNVPFGLLQPERYPEHFQLKLFFKIFKNNA